HGKIDDPTELETALIDQPKLLGNSAAGGAGEPGRGRRFVGSKKKAVAGSNSRLVPDLALNVHRHELGDRTFAFVALPYDVSEPCCAHVRARPLDQFVEPGAWLAGGAGRRNCPHDATRFDDVLESIERNARLVELLRHIGNHQWIAQIRLVGSVLQDRRLIRNERKFRRQRLAARELLEYPAHHWLDRLEYVLLGDEAHFQVELIKFTGRAIGARVLVAEARRDLKVAVEPRDHDQLLELLRRLRQRVKFARMKARRNEIVARALGRGCGQDGRLEFEEALLL